MNTNTIWRYGFLFVLIATVVWLVVSKNFPIESSQAASQPDLPSANSQKDGVASDLEEKVAPSVEASNFRVQDGFFISDICFDRPSRGDWVLALSTSLEVPGQTIQVFEIGLLDPSTDIDSAQRCDYLRFPIGDLKITDFRIVVPRLETSFPDSLDCPSAQQKLDAAGTGIVIRCVRGNGFYGPELVSKPSTLSEEEAHKMIYEAFIEIFPGPWVFEGTLE